MNTMQAATQIMIGLGGIYGIIFLIMMVVYAVMREWQMVLTSLGFALLVEALVALVAASVAWPTFGLCWAIPLLVVLFVRYLRSENERAKARYYGGSAS